uniref:Uncharacterized protein n=1 Tax=Arion vulgaris TaxID=1028688 RepID=A0A0B7AB95_9EUPU
MEIWSIETTLQNKLWEAGEDLKLYILFMTHTGEVAWQKLISEDEKDITNTENH